MTRDGRLFKQPRMHTMNSWTKNKTWSSRENIKEDREKLSSGKNVQSSLLQYSVVQTTKKVGGFPSITVNKIKSSEISPHYLDNIWT